MKARHFSPVAPLHVAPAGPYVTPSECDQALADALRGVTLGGYDEIVCARLVRILDLSSLRVVVSMMERVRAAGMVEALDADNVLRARHPQPPHGHGDRAVAPTPPRHRERGYYGLPGIPGNSGPSF